MLTTNAWLDKLAAVPVDFANWGMLEDSVLESVFEQLGESCLAFHSVKLILIILDSHYRHLLIVIHLP